MTYRDGRHIFNNEIHQPTNINKKELLFVKITFSAYVLDQNQRYFSVSLAGACRGLWDNRALAFKIILASHLSSYLYWSAKKSNLTWEIMG